MKKLPLLVLAGAALAVGGCTTADYPIFVGGQGAETGIERVAGNEPLNQGWYPNNYPASMLSQAGSGAGPPGAVPLQ